MKPCQDPPRLPAVVTGVLILVLVCGVLICGCLRTEPEELLPQPTASLTKSPPLTSTFSPDESLNATENATVSSMPVNITGSNKLVTFADLDFPEDVNQAVSDLAERRTADQINGFLRWESVRARTNESDTAFIRKQIALIDYAVFNSTLPEDIRVYFGVSGEQFRRIRNESVVNEPGYIIASSDPTIIYHRVNDSGRDREGYLILCTLDLPRGDHVLVINRTEREFLVPRGRIWDVSREETFESLKFTPDSNPRYDKELLTKIRIIYTSEHP